MKYHWIVCEMMMMMKSSGSSSTDAIHIKAATIFLKRPHVKIMLEEGREINTLQIASTHAEVLL